MTMFGFGATKPKEKFDIADTVDRLCERIATSSVIEDRRDAVRGLKGLSRKYRVEVGAQGLQVLSETMKKDGSDSEIMVLSVDTLYNVMNDTVESHEDDTDETLDTEAKVPPSDLGVQFTEMFLKYPDILSPMLCMMEDYEFSVRWSIVKFLSLLVENAPLKVQSLVLASPTAVSRIIDLLSDPREIIRNQALILLTFIARNNSAIQKIFAFECGFEKILRIIEDEGFSEGLIVVEDCINLMSLLLYQNISNLTFFLEGGFTSNLSTFFNFTCNDETNWGKQKIRNVVEMLALIKKLTSPEYPQQTVTAFQKVLFKNGILNKISAIVVSPSVPVVVLSESLLALGNMISHNRSNQNMFENVMTLSNPPRPALLFLLQMMVTEKQPLALKVAVLYLFHSFLEGNDDKKTDVINTLLPSKVDISNVTSGQLLCAGMFSKDPASNWLCAVALSYSLQDTQKDQLLRVQLATSIGNAPVTLMQQAVSVLTHPDSSIQAKIGIMILLSTWLRNCPAAVSSFLRLPPTMPFFINQLLDTNTAALENVRVAQGLAAFLLGICYLHNEDKSDSGNFDRKSIRHIVDKRIQLETFKRQVSSVSNFELFIKNAAKGNFMPESIDHLVFDFAFVALFKETENDLLRSISGVDTKDEVAVLNDELNKLKETARLQVDQIQTQELRNVELNQKYSISQSECESLKFQLARLSEDNATKENLASESFTEYKTHADTQICQLQNEVVALKTENDSLTTHLNTCNSTIERLNEQIAGNSEQLALAANEKERLVWYETQYVVLQQQYEQIYQQLYELQVQFNQQFDPEAKLQVLQARIDELESSLAQSIQTKYANEEEAKIQGEIQAQYKSTISEMQVKISALLEENERVQSQLESTESKLYARADAVSEVTTSMSNGLSLHDAHMPDVSTLTHERDQLARDLAQLKTDQEDLLALLADQEGKIRGYRDQLRHNGIVVHSSDESSESSDDTGDDTENHHRNIQDYHA